MIKEAIEITKRLTNINPNLSVAHKNLSSFYRSLGMYKEAAESLKQVIKIEPDMSLLFLKLRDKDSAFREYQILKEISPAIANKLSIQFH